MAFNADNEMLQDFLIEAGELLDGLNGQLIDLERTPDDRDPLNAVFRGFHTIKGGAGFLEITPLVEVCHIAEDVFNLLRNGERRVDARLMDVMLRVLDVLNQMFAELHQGQLPDPADPGLLRELARLRDGNPAPAPAKAAPVAAPAPTPVVSPVPVVKPVAPAPLADAADTEFEALLADLREGDTGVTDVEARDVEVEAVQAVGGTGSDLITDEEFEALLDKLHGPGKFSAPAPEEPPVVISKGEDLITDDEFEKVLDQMYGAGKGPTSAGGAAEATAEAATDGAAASMPMPVEDGADGVAANLPATRPATGRGDAKSAAAPEKAETTVRVDTERLDAIMNLVGELVLVRNRLNTLKATFDDEQVSQVIASLDMVTSDLQAAVMKTRMQPVKKVFGRFPRVVRDVSRVLGKEVELIMEGEETDLDKNLVEALADPLIHLVRNAVDHGIEMPDVRQRNSKPRIGTVVLSAAQEGDHILLSIRDDGAGMDPEKLRRKAVEKGMMDAETAERLTEQECFELILLPGFSTKEQISDISGRGVGMDVVKTAISRLSGTINISSEVGAGTLVMIKVPLTLAILPTLMVVVNRRKYAMPLGVVSEIFEIADKETNVVDGQLSITVRQKALPLFNLRRWLSIRNEEATPGIKDGQVVLVQIGAQTVGLIVDSVIGQEEVVIKPLGEILYGLPGFAGATITGDGHIALILDLPSLLRHYGARRSDGIRY